MRKRAQGRRLKIVAEEALACPSSRPLIEFSLQHCLQQCLRQCPWTVEGGRRALPNPHRGHPWPAVHPLLELSDLPRHNYHDMRSFSLHLVHGEDTCVTRSAEYGSTGYGCQSCSWIKQTKTFHYGEFQFIFGRALYSQCRLGRI